MSTNPLAELFTSALLVDQESTRNGFNPEMVTSEVGTIYFGTGLTTHLEPSVGLPFDVIGMLVTAEKVRQSFGLRNIIQVVADTHAKSNPFINPKEVDELGRYVVDTMRRVSRLLHLDTVYTPLLSSQFDQSPNYLEVFHEIQAEDHEYVRREWSDIEFLRRHHGLQVKLSWTIGGKTKKVGYDERLYDLRFREVTGQHMSFVYMVPGRTFDIERQKVSPYISVENERRVLLKPETNVVKIFEEVAALPKAEKLRSTFRHLEIIVSEFESLFGSLGDIPLAEKIQTIISMIFS